MTTRGEDLPTPYAAPDWDSAARAFLAEKRERSGSQRTPEEYERLLARFFGPLGKTPDQVAPEDVHAFAYGAVDGRKPKGATINMRLAALSAFYGFLERMGYPMPSWKNGQGTLRQGNPCAYVQRSRQEPAAPRGLDRDEIKRLLAAIPDTAVGLRDRAAIMMFVYTGRRRSEILGLRAGDLSRNGAVFYAYRGKGGKQGRRELPEPCFLALLEALRACGKELREMEPHEPLFDVSPHGFYMNLRRYFRKAKLPPGGVHVLRHSAAKLRRDVGQSVEEVSSFLDHSSLAVTTTYLRRLEGEEDKGWREVQKLLD